MTIFNKAEVARSAKEYGFVRDTFEKVLRLNEILQFMNQDPFLKEHLILKGGTAINLTIFNLPRLSVDIDLDYVPNDALTVMQSVREAITARLLSYINAEGYILSPASRFSHSLDAFFCQYQNLGGNRDLIKIEINYSLRSHVYPPVQREILPSVLSTGTLLRTADPLEIFAAKGSALINRTAARDLFDWCSMIDAGLFSNDLRRFRKCFIFYASISSDDIISGINTDAIDSITFHKIRRDLFPVMNQKGSFDLDRMKHAAKHYITDTLKPSDRELEYLRRFSQKEYRPELLFDEAAVLQRIKQHPTALWKCRPL